MKVRFYSFSKRNKSTKQPTGDYLEKELQLKDATSVINPVFLVQTFSPLSYNYAYVVEWERYYFITDVKNVTNMWEIAMVEDILASFKAEIGTTSASILYATGATGNIVDPRIPVKADVLRDSTQATITDLTFLTQGGPIIIGITGKGSFGPYLMQSPTQIREMLDGVDGVVVTFGDLKDWAKQQAYGDSAAQCLRSAFTLPFTINAGDVSSGTAEDLVLGNYPCLDGNGNPIKGYHITKPIIVKHGTITIPWISNDWKRVSAYSTVELYIPLVGMITIPATEVKDDSTLSIDLSINVTSGDIAVLVKGGTTGKIVANGSGNCALPTAYGSTGIDTGKQNQAIATGIGAVVSLAAAAYSGGASIALKAASGLAMAGSAGMMLQKDLTVSQADMNLILGKPVMAVHTVGTYSGFVQTDGFQFQSTKAYSSEKDTINEMLDAGIYYE